MFGLKKTLILCAAMLSAAGPALACDNDDANGLDVGLVLSGGGAKASTQVGVMQVMDELGIPVHCIAGTSMGAVVGSFYANGYSANEISDILTDNDWGALFRGSVPRRDKSYIEKEREDTYFSGNVASYSFKDGLSLPGGLSSMQGLKTHYRQILADVPMDMEFDDFIIPYRAVATNLHDGAKKEFERGDIVDVILASMAVPGVFPPREIGGDLYVDGGLSTNLPVQTALDMGADIIIAVDVSNAPTKPGKSMSVAATANQITTIVVWQKVLKERSKLDTNKDLLITPNEEINISTAGYEQSAKGLAEGRRVGMSLANSLLAIKAKAAPSRRNSAQYKFKTSTDKLLISNTTNIEDALIRRRFDWEHNEPKTPKDERRRLRNLASFGGFGEVDIGRSNGDATLTVSENALGRNLIQVGVNATSNFEGDSSYSLLARLTRKPLGKSGGDISLSAEFGSDIGLSAELYQPFGPRGRYFFQPEIYATWEDVPLEFFEQPIADIWRRDVGVRARIGRELGSWGILALEGEFEATSAAIQFQTDEIDGIPSFETANVGLFFALDTLNRSDWPTDGQRLRASAKRAYQFENDTEITDDQFEASWLGAYQALGVNALVNARYGKSIARQGLAQGSFTLGGFRQLGSVSNDSLLVNEFGFLSVELFDRLTTRGRLLDLPIYFGGIAEYAHLPLFFVNDVESIDALVGTIYIGIDTPLGPAFLGGSYGNNNDGAFFFKFGRTF